MNHTHIANPVPVTAVRILGVTDVTKRDEGCDQFSPDLLLRLENGANFEANSGMTARHVPVAGDYVVTQEDGYVYLNPKDVFERKYSPAQISEKLGAGFGIALIALKADKRLARKGWNGKGMWIELHQPMASCDLPYIRLSYPVNSQAYPEGARVPWAPSQTDVLAEDWVIVP